LVRCPEFNRAYEYAIHLLRSGGITSDLGGEGNRRGRRRPMDWLVRLMFARLIRVGNLRVTTAGGSAFTFGGSTRQEAADGLVGSADVRKVDPRRKSPGDHRGGIDFHLWGQHRDILRSHPLHHASGPKGRPPRSRIEIRRSVYGWRRCRRSGLDRRCPCHRTRSAPRSAGVDAAAMAHPLCPSPHRAVQSAQASAAQRSAPLRSRRPTLRAVPRCRPAIQLRLFRNPRAIA
jgi:hypothetical protein